MLEVYLSLSLSLSLSLIHPYFFWKQSHMHTFLPQIASHPYSVVLRAATRTDGSHFWLVNYAATSLDSESAEE